MRRSGSVGCVICAWLIAACALEASTDEAAEVTNVQAALNGYCDVPADCDDGSPCTSEQCLEHHCIYTPVSGPCDDGSACTLNDQCQAGECQGTEVVELLSGSQLPSSEGWTGYGDNAATTNGSVVTIDTTSIPLSYRYATHGIGLDASALVSHDLQWGMQVRVADHNQYDASVAILPEFTGWYGWGPNTRAQMIYFEEDHIGWGDQSGSYTVDTTVARDYLLRVTPTGDAEVYVGTTLALTRSGYVIGPMLGFGDQTNDWGVDGDFDIWKVRLVPKPWCKSL